jgi:hypothetical protein
MMEREWVKATVTAWFIFLHEGQIIFRKEGRPR